MDLNILICGIGGQGVVFLGSFLRNVLLQKYPNAICVGTESRGVSQREGSVISTVRIKDNENSKRVFSPEIPLMGANVVIAMEPIELLRNFSVVNSNTLLILNNEPTIPKSSVLSIKSNYAEKNFENVKNFSQPRWLVEKMTTLHDLNPIKFTDTSLPLTKPEKKVLTVENMKYFSNSPRVLDLNFSSLVLDELDSSIYLNLVMTGFLITFISTWLDLRDLQNFIINEYEDNQDILEKNLNALKYGEILAINYSNLRKFS